MLSMITSPQLRLFFLSSFLSPHFPPPNEQGHMSETQAKKGTEDRKRKRAGNAKRTHKRTRDKCERNLNYEHIICLWYI